MNRKPDMRAVCRQVLAIATSSVETSEAVAVALRDLIAALDGVDLSTLPPAAQSAIARLIGDTGAIREVQRICAVIPDVRAQLDTTRALLERQ